MTDVTASYFSMIQAIECDFNLAADPESSHGLDELQLKIEQGDERLLKDIQLLRELSCGVRQGKLRIVQLAGYEEAGNSEE